ncbi:molybdopterin-guanine dinucleotide biosynthesis protein B [Verminephrobacter eiseniae]|uniref:molybdopterin-guanine dinucleotide biosynthesis protein B n=1 Tax=Verminephrobacter eiseniae TaxID=364317 RepID=UPI0010DBB0C6|nr:molybdopterin-guanine dinucleotide biosynthesis protein B [Verminephrobacter eiseniae]KAB7565771.1 molybdopterin-guanine dinucleotide biosynthesis protein B [Verminephrobacter sp. Larva24]MCW5232148.1 molybdopterin-guanine dinucleotide biosynthesis protein B [Verminephrobacter eiseniae]MCW8184097.1 molybdopterin-guanine dinucleotide biosynthesis protein B [Verminephrobacter eiseniae]MCW8222584.1 molybdopterin-guanine dinucleotide biosynthesis protein B [Verminephrobacter eiseniae]
MKVAGFAGFSGSGKTTLIEQLIPALRRQGLRVSVVKHAHHRFDIDHPGKDTYRHREAGAFEVVAASDRRLALMREFEQATTLSVHQLLAELCQDVDWVLVEGFKGSDLPKIEVWRPPHPGETGAPGRKPEPVRYPGDDCVVAVATNAAHSLPVPTTLPVLDLDAPDQVAGWLIRQGQRFGYERPLHGGRLRCAPQ